MGNILPTISVCMATLNAEAVISEGLCRLSDQDYSKENILSFISMI